MACEKYYAALAAAEKAKVDSAIEKLAKMLANGQAQVVVNPVTGKPTITGWTRPKDMSDLCCLARAQEYATEGQSSLAFKANWQTALRSNPGLKADFVHQHNHAHGSGHKH
jgi:hypothetical protein